jgi:pseudouridine synthase
MKIVLQKFIASTGHCSRRQAEELIRNGLVRVGSKKAELGMFVEENDKIYIDNELINVPADKIYLKLNKPVGYTCTNRRFAGEQSVIDLVETDERLFVVGRLDKTSRGLVILTNDGDWAHKLSHPKFCHEKEYLVIVAGDAVSGVDAEIVMRKLKKGIDIGDGDGTVAVKKIDYLGNNEFRIILGEGKKRQIRRMMRAAGLEVRDLLRVRIGDIELGKLSEGKAENIDKKLILS